MSPVGMYSTDVENIILHVKSVCEHNPTDLRN